MAPDLVAAAAAAGLVLDAGLGEPPAAIHPVVWMGRLATVLEGVARRRALGPQAERLAGAAVALGVVGVATGMAMAALRLAGAVSPMLELVVGAWLVFTSVAWRGLRQAVGDVAAALRRQDLPAARHLLQRVVGRETARLPAWEVARAAVESVAENTVDAVVAPFFYALLAGPAGAVAYRAVNTLDAMFGYRDDRYRYFGWASARLDDLANYLPARLAALLFPLAAAAAGRSAGATWRAVRRDGRRHRSPNAGLSEAAVAGALGVRLGGVNVYGGRPSFHPYLGGGRLPTAADVEGATQVCGRLVALTVALGLLARWAALDLWRGA